MSQDEKENIKQEINKAINFLGQNKFTEAENACLKIIESGDNADAFPTDPTETADTDDDGDGILTINELDKNNDAIIDDTDNDGVPDYLDPNN